MKVSFPLILVFTKVSRQDYFNGKELNKSINPDEAVAYGAAVQVPPQMTNPIQSWY